MPSPHAQAVERRHPPDALMRLVNPIVRRLVARGGPVGQHVLLLHCTGRKSGRRFDVPAGFHVIDGVPTVFTSSAWRQNFRGGRDLEVTLRGNRHRARAVLVDDPAVVAGVYHRIVEQLGWQAAQRRLGVRVNVERDPTLGELQEMISRSGLALVRIETVDDLT